MPTCSGISTRVNICGRKQLYFIDPVGSVIVHVRKYFHVKRHNIRSPITLSYKTIGQAIDASNNTVRKYVLELEAAGLIATNRTVVLDANGKERNGSLRYTILPVQNAVELHHQRRLAALDAAVEQQRVKKRLAASARKGGAAQ